MLILTGEVHNLHTYVALLMPNQHSINWGLVFWIERSIIVWLVYDLSVVPATYESCETVLGIH